MKMTFEKREALAKKLTGSVMQFGAEGRAIYSNLDASEIYIAEKDDAEDGEDFFVSSLDPIIEACANVAWYAYAGNGEPATTEWIKGIVGSAVFKIVFEAEKQAEERLAND